MLADLFAMRVEVFATGGPMARAKSGTREVTHISPSQDEPGGARRYAITAVAAALA